MNKKEAINKPIWLDTVEMNTFPSLTKDIKTDILVIGGGLGGILTAYKLKEAGFDVTLIEKKRIGMGITKGTTAFVSAQHDTMYQELVKKIGYKKAKLYLSANLEAIKDYENLAVLYDFDYENVDSCFYSKDNDVIIKQEIETLKKLEYNALYTDTIPLPIKITSGVVFSQQGQMNALKLINALTKNLNIYENTEAIEITNNVVKTKQHKIEAQKIIICTHFPIHNNIRYSMRMYQDRSYVVAIENNEKWKGLYTDVDSNRLYFRKYQDYLIIGGSDKRVGKEGDCYKKLKAFIDSNYPNQPVRYYWGNQDLVTLDNVAYIGKINACNSNMYVATGFNLWGMTTSMISANIIVDLVQDKKNKYEELYKPSRWMINKQLFSNMVEFIKNQFGINKKRCTHLNCILKYNECENTWECPCHGSRFTPGGEVLDDPAKEALK